MALHKRTMSFGWISIFLFVANLDLLLAYRGFPPPPPPPQGYHFYRPAQNSRSGGGPIQQYYVTSGSTPTPTFSHHHVSHQTPYLSSFGTTTGRPRGGGLMSWLGSQVARLPGLGRITMTASPYSSTRSPPGFPYQKYKQHIHHHPGSYGSKPSSVIAPSNFNVQPANEVTQFAYPGATNTNPKLTPTNTIFQVIAPDGTSRYQTVPPQGYENFFGQQDLVKQALAPSQQGAIEASSSYGQYQVAPPPPAPYFQYQSPPAPAQLPSKNIEVLQSQMIAYDKETVAPNQPEYQSAVEGMATAASTYGGSGNPVYYQQQLGEGYQAQPVKRIDDNLGSLFVGVVPNVAPIYDMAGQQPLLQQQQADMNTAYSNYQPYQYAQQISQQYQQQIPQQYQQQIPQQYPEFAEAPSQVSDLDTSESSLNYNQVSIGSALPPGVQLLNQGATFDGNGNPTLELLADANAPKLEGGHPFDINQLVAMIEPGAQIDPNDIVKEGDPGAGKRQKESVGLTQYITTYPPKQNYPLQTQSKPTGPVVPSRLNPLFDSVLGHDNDYDYNYETDESRQVSRYAITVTPPTTIFHRLKQNDVTPTTPVPMTDIHSGTFHNSITAPIFSIETTEIQNTSQRRYPVYRKQQGSNNVKNSKQ